MFHMVAHSQGTKNELIKPVRRDGARIFPRVYIEKVWYGCMFGNLSQTAEQFARGQIGYPPNREQPPEPKICEKEKRSCVDQ